ncbi:RIP metalloprotease RseP [Proteiniclasticum sp. BAD-10]|uniref:Zinc metalloprotease n=1 Tax=Proteiniclasticum sediminis TaxID=2804028 RepID=A0A941CMW4_9CLOT|nr:RIP metalloprotease RseP [Proteiniclasticum sediminis]MBR0575490.1 RIP metalloprotease RseP [Proteiniclasticum sediminis]
MYLALSIFAFGLLVLGHEFGHFILARLNGVKVEEFSIGMGPRLFQKQGKNTLYSIKALPIGGSVKMYGETEEATGEDSFFSKSPLRKISIIAAGPLMNIVMALLVIFVFVLFNGYTSSVIKEVLPNTPAQAAGLEPGDRILSVNGEKVFTFQDISTYISYNGMNKLTLEVAKEEGDVMLSIMPIATEEGRPYVGIVPVSQANPGFGETLGATSNQTLSLINQTLFSLKVLFSGNASLNDFGGPVTIFKYSTQAASISLWNLASFAAFLSINLAVLNLIPFPALDGGWILILLVELITRKKLPDKFVGIWNTIGFVVLMGFMLLITFKDIFLPGGF